MGKRIKILVISAVAIVVLVGSAGLLWWFTRDEAPEAVNLESAVERLESAGAAAGGGDADRPDDAVNDGESAASTPTTAAAAGETNDSGAPSTTAASNASDDTTSAETPAVDPPVDAASLAGGWTVDTADSGTDVSGDPAVSFAGFRVDEVLAGGIGDFTAVGRTADVWGSVALSDTELVEATVEVDFRTLRTDDGRRDFRVQQALDTAQHPIAVFTLSEPMPVPASAAEGVPFSGSAAGELIIKGVSNSAVFDLDAQLVGDRIIVVGASEVVFANYGVIAPTAPIVVSVEDHGIMEFQLILNR